MPNSATAQAEKLKLGDVVYIWRCGQLEDATGRSVPLRAKSLKMFQALLSERGTTLSKQRLSELIWPDTVATDESIARCIADIRKALCDEDYKIVQTFAKQGYRLNVSTVTDPREAPVSRPKARWLALAAVGALVALTLAFPSLWSAKNDAEIAVVMPPSEVQRHSIAIIPFVGHEESDQFLAAGLSDDLETRLSEVSRIRLLSQVQTAAAADKAKVPTDLARDLGAGYLVQGRLRQNAGQVALSLQLIDGTDGSTVWADRYEGPRDGLVAFRNTVPEALVKAMALELNAQDRLRLAHQDTSSPQALEEVMHARREINAFTYDGSLAAEKHLRRAIAIDPQYARAYAELAAAFAIRIENNWIVLSRADSQKAFYFAQKALELDSGLWLTHYALGRLHSVAATGNLETARHHLRQAMALQPANDDARAYYAVILLMSGRVEEAHAIFESVMATHPEPPFWYHLGFGNTLFHLRRYEEALQSIARCLAQMPNSPYCLRSQIAILAQMNRVDDAAWAIEEYAILGHDISLDVVMTSAIERDEGMQAHLRASYRRAGLE